MKRKTMLALLLPALVLAAAALMAGRHYVAMLPDGSQVNQLVDIEQSMAFRESIEEIEPMISIAIAISTAALLFAVVVILIRISGFPKVAEWRARAFSVVQATDREWVFLAAGLAAAVVVTGLLLLSANAGNHGPTGDEISYLEEAIQTRDNFGVAGFPAALYTGKWSEHNRHPLYISLVMPFAAKSPAFFVKARLVTTILAAASVFVVFLVTKKLFSAAAAVLVVFVYGLNTTFVQMSSAIMCEVLLVTLVMGSFYFTVRGFQKNGLLWAGGALAGLAYMTKFSGLFLPVAFFAAALVVWRLGAFRQRGFYAYFIAFVIVASPLLARNTIRYGNPFSNYNFSLLWLDKRGQTDTVRFREGRTGMGYYFAEHDTADMGERMAEGSESVAEAAVLAASPMRQGRHHFGPSRGYPLKHWSGCLVLGAVLVFLVFDTNRARKAFTAALAIIVFLPIAWNVKIAPASTYIFPFMPIALAYFAGGAVWIFQSRRWRAGLMIGASLLAFGAVTGRLRIAQPLHVRPPDPEVVRLAEWLAENMERNELYLLGPDEAFRFGWFMERPARTENIPNTHTIADLVQDSRKRGARHVVITRGFINSRMLQFRGLVRFENGNMEPMAINGWRPVFEDPRAPVDYIVYEVLGEDAGEHAGE